MKSLSSSFFMSVVICAGLAGSAGHALAAQGQNFPKDTCTCQGCAKGGGDLTGKCGSVCKDKTVYSAGSEPHDYCKAARLQSGFDLFLIPRQPLQRSMQ
jgi:hypothetical protein